MTRCVTLWVSPKALLPLFLQTAALLPTELKGGKSGRARSCRETFGVWCCPVLTQRDSEWTKTGSEREQKPWSEAWGADCGLGVGWVFLDGIVHL